MMPEGGVLRSNFPDRLGRRRQCLVVRQQSRNIRLPVLNASQENVVRTILLGLMKQSRESSRAQAVERGQMRVNDLH